MAHKVLVLCADGAEDIELVTTLDVLHRAKISTRLAAIRPSAKDSVSLANGTKIIADTVGIPERAEHDYEAVVLPGGSQAAQTFTSDASAQSAVTRFNSEGKIVAAICASPMALAKAGVLRGLKACIYPGMEAELERGGATADRSGQKFVIDGKVLTSRGPGTAMAFALELVGMLQGAEAKATVAKQLLYPN